MKLKIIKTDDRWLARISYQGVPVWAAYERTWKDALAIGLNRLGTWTRT